MINTVSESARIRMLRAYLGVTQVNFARQLGVAPKTLGLAESGKGTVPKVVREAIDRYFDINNPIKSVAMSFALTSNVVTDFERYIMSFSEVSDNKGANNAK